MTLETTTKKERIKPEIIEMIKDDKALKFKLCLHFDKSVFTITRYLDNNNTELTKISVLKLIAKHFGTDIENLTESY